MGLSCPSASSTPNCLYSCLGFKPFRSVLSAPNYVGISPQRVRFCRTQKGFLFADIREVNVPGQKLLPILFSGAAGDPVQESPKVIHLVYVVQLRVLCKRIHHAGNLCTTVSIGKEPVRGSHRKRSRHLLRKIVIWRCMELARICYELVPTVETIVGSLCKLAAFESTSLGISEPLFDFLEHRPGLFGPQRVELVFCYDPFLKQFPQFRLNLVQFGDMDKDTLAL
jgi:hypothetical protein